MSIVESTNPSTTKDMPATAEKKADDGETKSPDPHNETTVSEISADITLDSVKDHTGTQVSETVNTDGKSTLTTKVERVEQSSASGDAGTNVVIKTTTITTNIAQSEVVNGEADGELT